MKRLPACTFFAVIVFAGCAQLPKSNTPAFAEDLPPAVGSSLCPSATLASSRRFLAQPFDSGLPNTGQRRDGFDLADMNGDGHLDLVSGPARKGVPQPLIFLGDGHGHFSLWAQAHFPPLTYDYGDAKAADFNGDGVMDIALSMHLRGLVTLIGEGAGHYAPWGEGLPYRAGDAPPDDSTFGSRAIAIVDWNADGKPDLLALNEGPSRFTVGNSNTEALSIHLNRDGYWQHLESGQPLHGFGDSIATGDVNGDGRPDALMGSEVAGARTLLQIGTLTDAQPAELQSLPTGASVTATLLHDFNGDGLDEAVVGSRAPTGDGFCTAVAVTSVRREGGERSSVLWREISLLPMTVLKTADLDRDGFADLIAVRQNGDVHLFAGSAQGFSRDLVLAAPTPVAGCQAFDAGVADLDGDQQIELVVGFAGEDAGDGSAGCASGGGFVSWRLRGR